MKTFQNWFSKNYPNEEFPKGNINGQWFVDHNIPMIVSCTCCGATMASPSALIDNEGQVFCSQCGEPQEEEEISDKYTLSDLGNNWY